MAKVHVFLVKPITPTQVGVAVYTNPRLIRGTLREVEAKLRQEVDIRPATADEAHSMADVVIEEAGSD